MKITKSQLRQIIQETKRFLQESESIVYRDKHGRLRYRDDEGNDEPADDMEDEFGYLNRNDHGETIRPRRRRYRSSQHRW